MKLSKLISSKNIKFGLLFLALTISIGTLYYSQNLIKKLQEREDKVVELFADGERFIANSESTTDYTFVFNTIIGNIDFPLLLTDKQDSVLSYRNIIIDPKLSQAATADFLQSKVKEYSQIHSAIPVEHEGLVLSKIYYGDSELIQQLRFYPYLQILIAFLFLLIAYTSFNYLKKSEESNIWVGMSKETAHQLGTPISSLMGWNEILKLYYENPDKVLDTSQEIESDLYRLNKIIQRFSKIGSRPELKDENIYEVILRVVSYFNKRLPRTGKKNEIVLTGNENLITKLNAELFEWVIENLIKNALDAIESNEAKIKISISETNKNIEVEVNDNGKGIDYKLHNEIFKPGYSTKRRGWGLGLSLSKRIVEDYHSGKIFLKNSNANEGATFKIILKK